MRAIGSYIIITDLNSEVKTEGGILLSGEDKDSMRYGVGEVLSIGSLVKSVVDGDKIYYDKRQAFTMMVSNKPVTVIQERDVIIVL